MPPAELEGVHAQTGAPHSKRRDFITLLGGAGRNWGEGMPRVGAMMLLAENDPEQKAWTEAFLQGLQEAG